jgi:DNA-binding winged helix-turn-helix (wHTH) protein/tetratricopeptide (TPR) repeat protein
MKDEGGAPPEIFRFDQFRVDARKRVLLHQDQQVRLTPKVFETLLYLVQHPGRVLDKDELMRAVWPDVVVEENNLNQNVAALRRAFGEKHYILTVPRKGYRFTPEVQIEAVTTLAARPQPIRTLAVLPFKALTELQRDEALELGMADTLIARLSQTREVIVRPLSSVRRFSSPHREPQAAARELKVEAVLDGSIQRSHGQVRVTVRVLRVADGTSIWSGTFDEKLTNVFQIQDAIAERVASALELRLSAEERRALTRHETENKESYRLYLTGRYHWNKLIPSEIRQAIQFFQRAIDLDPTYALAYAGLAECYRSLPITSDTRPKESFPLAKAAITKALAIDQSLPELYAISVFVKFWYDWDWAGAESDANRAVTLNPNSPEAHRARAHLFSNLGRHEEAILEVRTACELDPLALITRTLEARFLFSAGLISEARDRVFKVLEIDPEFWVARLTLGDILTRQGDYSAALVELRRARRNSGRNTQTIALSAYASALNGDAATAVADLAELKALATEQYVPPYNLAMVYNALGQDTLAFEQLEHACAERDVHLSFLKIDFRWDRLRSESRFVNLQRRVGLV